jgi:hypothetical protein
MYPKSAESRSTLLNFLQAIAIIMVNDEDDKGVDFVIETIGYDHIKEIVVEYVKYPASVEFVDILTYALKILATITGANDSKYITGFEANHNLIKLLYAVSNRVSQELSQTDQGDEKRLEALMNVHKLIIWITSNILQ